MCFCKRRRRRGRCEQPVAARHDNYGPAAGQDYPEVNVREFDCEPDRQVIKHKHIVRHQHDIVNEYEVIHEHDCNYYDVVMEREVVRHNDFTSHNTDYCERPRSCSCEICRCR